MKTAILLALLSHVFADTCWLDNAKVTSPFVINDDFTIPLVDVDKRIHYNEGDSFYVKCRPGLTNSLISDEGDVVICMTKTLILNARTTQTLDFATLFCKPKTPLGAVRRRNATCANDFSLYDIGVSIDETVFAPLVTVCFDEDKLSPFYAETLQPYRRDSSSGELASLDAYPFFQDAGGVYGANLDLLYFDSEAVMSALGVDGYPLRPLPLLRTEIFVDPLYQRLELDYIASFPANRSLGAVQPWCPDSLVGTLGVATGTNDKGETVELYLNDGTVPVPEWLWCVHFDGSEEMLDGFFNLTHLVRDTAKAEASWGRICPDGTLVVDESSGMVFGKCPFGDVVDEKLKGFLAERWTHEH